MSPVRENQAPIDLRQQLIDTGFLESTSTFDGIHVVGSAYPAAKMACFTLSMDKKKVELHTYLKGRGQCSHHDVYQGDSVSSILDMDVYGGICRRWGVSVKYPDNVQTVEHVFQYMI